MSGTGWTLRTTTASADETRALAGRLAGCCRPGDVVLLSGGLGAGKTTFAQGFAAALGVEGPVTSPTFTLVRPYRCASPNGVTQLLHADVYRLERRGEVLDLGLGELVEEEAVALVEWGEAAAPALGPDALAVTLARPDGAPEDRREVVVRGTGAAWAGRADAVAGALGAAA